MVNQQSEELDFPEEELKDFDIEYCKDIYTLLISWKFEQFLNILEKKAQEKSTITYYVDFTKPSIETNLFFTSYGLKYIKWLFKNIGERKIYKISWRDSKILKEFLWNKNIQLYAKEMIDYLSSSNKNKGDENILDILLCSEGFSNFIKLIEWETSFVNRWKSKFEKKINSLISKIPQKSYFWG